MLVFAYSDLSEMSDSALDEYIGAAREHCRDQKKNTVNSLTEATRLLQMALAEKNSRSAAKQVEAANVLAQETNQLARETLLLSKQTILLWWLAIGLAVISIAIALFK